MKVYLSNYRDHWLSPYKIMEKVIFWREIDYDEPFIEKCNTILEPVCNVLKSVLDTIHPRVNYVKIDRYDTWSLDSTLSQIIVPMLKQLKASKHGAPYVDDKDVPKELRSTSAPPKENSWDTDDNHFKRWDWVLGEMIWAFEQCVPDNDWEAQYFSGESDIQWVKKENGMSEMVKGPKDTRKFDAKGYTAHEKRIVNGTTLFGKYYKGLWD
jgi:hypothetical protein